MLALTTDASDAIERLLASPEVPEGAGIRIAGVEAASNGDAPSAPGLQLSIAPEPDGHDVVIEDAGARVFVEEPVVALLDDKLLDVSLDGERVQFKLTQQD